MDVLVTYLFDMQKHKRIDSDTGYHIREFKPDEIHELSEITLECFGNHIKVTDHFHADPTLPREKSDLLYVKWLIDSCNDANSVVLVAERDGKPVGFNVCRINDPLDERLGIRLGTMVLTAVKPSERRKLVASSMLNASLAWFAGKVDFVETGGQVSNYAVQSLWTKLGFKLIRSQCTFHWSVFPDSL
jgi:ribosomal protein S18 acetylase RimI-like enzyme